MTGIYLHIPFCKQACSYCDFYFVTRTRRKSDFVNILVEEITTSSEPRQFDEKVSTVYFGGGTPSLLTLNEVDKVMNAIRLHYDVSELTEVTFEMNPDDVKEDYISGLYQNGITRISMGVQTFNPERLDFMNRAHTRQEALNCLEILHSSPIESFNVDLIYGNPGQDLDDLAKDVETLLEYDPHHISAYSLTIEPRTKLGTLNKKGLLKVPNDETVAQHIDYLRERLANNDIQRYEISNYARPGYEARHNSAYWNHANYLGFGPAAHSFYWDADKCGGRRWKNKANLTTYLTNENKLDEVSVEHLNLLNLAEERLMMGLRTREGVTIQELENRYDYKFSNRQNDYLNRLVSDGYIYFNQTVRLTNKGIKIADSIISGLL